MEHAQWDGGCPMLRMGGPALRDPLDANVPKHYVPSP